MAEQVEQVRETTARDGNTVQQTRTVNTDDTAAGNDRAPGNAVAARVVWLIAGVIMGLLTIRFLLSLLGANRNNGFADFIYTISYPFAAPFFGLFGYDVTYGRARFEGETLVAIAVYALVAWLIAKAVTIRSRSAY